MTDEQKQKLNIIKKSMQSGEVNTQSAKSFSAPQIKNNREQISTTERTAEYPNLHKQLIGNIAQIQNTNAGTAAKPLTQDNKPDETGHITTNENKGAASGTAAATVTGTVFGNISNASTLYGQDMFNTPRGHGFAAERANHLFDVYTGQNAQFVGDVTDPATGTKIANGADRLVNGVQIQTKYCNSGSKSVAECFENGHMKYTIDGGKLPMQIEVPSDQYDDAVKAMENRIKKGEVPGVTDVSKAKEIIRKGHFTYLQAKNIARFGTVESLIYDAANSTIVSTSVFGITSVITFATNLWNGEDFDAALKSAAVAGLKAGGITFVNGILASQLTRLGLNGMLVGSTEAIAKVMGPKASAFIINAFRSGQNIYGAAAMKSVAKLLRTNAITSIASVVVLSAGDVVNIFRGRISGKQLFKNLTTTASSVGGGTVGFTAGAALGSVVPVVGTAIGGLIGALVGGMAAQKASKAILDNFIEDDANEMIDIIQKVFTKMAQDYLLNDKEAKNIVSAMSGKLTGKTLKDMFSSDDKEEFAEDMMIDLVENEVKNREHIKLPTIEQMTNEVKQIIEELDDEAVAESI